MTSTKTIASNVALPEWFPDLPPRRMPTLTDVLSILYAWATENYTKINNIYLHRGGWEAWAQTELAYYLTTRYPAINTFREEHVYVDRRQKADLLLLPIDRSQDPEAIIVELKAQSMIADSSSPTAFCKRMLEDIEKLDGDKVAATYLPAKVFAIGFTLTDQVSEQMNNRTVFGGYGPDINRIIVESDEMTDDEGLLDIWWWGKDIATDTIVPSVAITHPRRRKP